MLRKDYYSIPYEIHDLCELLYKSTAKFTKNIIAEQYIKGKLKRFTYGEFKADVAKISDYLIKNNLENSYILLISDLCYTWLVAYFAIIQINSTVVCVDKSLFELESVNEVLKGFNLSSCILNKNFVSKSPVNKIVIDFESISNIIENSNSDIIIKESTRIINPSKKIALVLFTSGTTGKVKPVYLSHENLAHNIMGSQMLMGRSSKDRMLSFLPTYHAFEQTAGVLTPIFVGATICMSRGLKYAIKDMKEFSPTIMPIVPLIAETIKKNINLELRRHGSEKELRKLINWESIPIMGSLIKKLIFHKIVQYFGGSLKTFICGGAPLDINLQKEFLEYGFEFLNGYGITECSPVVSCTMKNRILLGSCGVPIPYCEVKSIKGEICVKGTTVAKKHKQNINSHMEFIDEWYKTGDLGYVDCFGNVFITGRKKDLIILANGENLSPESVECLINHIDGIEEVIVCTTKNINNNNVLTAVIHPKVNLMEKEDNELKKYFIGEIANCNLPNCYRIEKVTIQRKPFPRTASGKIRRYVMIQNLNIGGNIE